MQIDITEIDKVTLLQTLYLHADPKGKGKITYRSALKDGKTVEGLPEKECQQIFEANEGDGYFSIDYYNGKPLKLGWHTLNVGRIVVDTLPYDKCHGKYRFLEAMLNIFDAEEILILEKEYDIRGDIFFKSEDLRPEEQLFKEILDQSVLFTSDFGMIWKINPDGTGYKSSFLRVLDL